MNCKLVLPLAFACMSAAYSANAQLAPDVRTNIERQMEAGEYKAVTKALEKAQESGDASFETNELLIEAYYLRLDQVGLLKKKSIAGKMKKALERALEIQPGNVEAMSNLAQYHIEAPGIAGGDKDIARAIIEEIIALDPMRGHKLGAELARIEDDPDTAMVHVEKALDLDPANTTLIQMKGVIHADTQAFDAAIVTFESCVALDPANLECLYQIGKASQIGDIQRDKGIASFKSFLETGHENKNFVAHAHYRLGMLYAQSGDNASAKTQYDAAIKINGLKDAKEAKKKLD